MKAILASLIALGLFGTALAEPANLTKTPPRPPVALPLSVSPALAATAPDREKDYVAIIDKARKAYAAAKSVDARRAARVGMQIDAHNFMGLSHDAKGWLGIFKQATTLPNGKRALQIEIAPGVTIETWDNPYDDRVYETLIKPYVDIGAKLEDLSIGQPVSFNADMIGEVISSDDDMVLQPRIIARFLRLTTVEEPPPAKK